MGLLTDAITEAVEGWRKAWGEALKFFLAKPLEIGIDTVLDTLGKRMAPQLTPLITRLEATGQVPPELAALFKEIKEPTGEIAALLSYSAARGGLGLVSGGFLSTITSGLDYALKASIQPSLLDVRSIIDAERRRAAGKPFTDQEWLWTGFANVRRDILREVTRPLLGPEELRVLFYRFPALRGYVKEVLGKYGFTKLDIDQLELIWPVIPGVQDIIRMAVREAWREDFAAKWQTDADLPAEAADWAAKQGLSADWFKRYWRAHWELPSVGQGYEMLHRGQLTIEELRELMRAQDIMPGYRDKLIAISYSPFTRVDVRRMYSQGVLNREDVKRAYLDLGYNLDKAEKMTEFTIRYEMSTERDLTKADLVDGFGRGVLARAEALDDLLELGYSEDEAEYYLDKQVAKQAQAKIEAYASRYKKLYVKGLVDDAAVRAALSPVGATDAQITEYLDLWALDRQLALDTTVTDVQRDLSKADILSGYSTGLISPDEARGLLTALGYDPDEVEYYLSAQDLKTAKKTKELSLATWRSLYTSGQQGRTETTAGLAKLGFAEPEISLLYQLWDIEREDKIAKGTVAETRDLTRADILNGYSQGIILKDEAVARLKTLGYATIEIEVLLALHEIKREQTKRELSLTTYKSLYTTGVLSKSETTAALIDQGFAEEGIGLLFELWDIERQGRGAMPTMADLRRFLRKAIIDETVYRQELDKRGYSATYIEWFVEDTKE